MRIVHQAGRLVAVTGATGHEIAYDVEKAGSGRPERILQMTATPP